MHENVKDIFEKRYRVTIDLVFGVLYINVFKKPLFLHMK